MTTDHLAIRPIAASRFAVLKVFGVLTLAHLLLLIIGIERIGNGRYFTYLNDFAWTLISLLSAGTCLWVASRLNGREKHCWFTIGCGLLMWLVGQLVWNYYELYRGALPKFPHWLQLCFVTFPLSLTAGLVLLPKPGTSKGISVRRAGNLGLLICTWVSIFVLAIGEPAAQSDLPFGSIVASLMHAGTYAAACITALYLLWGYRWNVAYWPLTLVVLAMLFHSATFVIDLNARLTRTYVAHAWFNATWSLAFGAVAAAAYEYWWSRRHDGRPDTRTTLRRERLLEATMPALLIVSILVTALFNIGWITPRVIVLIAIDGAVFAVLLGTREAWIQLEEQRLLRELNLSNRQLVHANIELKRSERRVRKLNADLEQRVAKRTAELQGAYRELESFSYAVAHDIKAPLRAINGFGSLLQERCGNQLDEESRRYIERIRGSTVHLAQLVDDLLAYAQIERTDLPLDRLELKPLVDACIAERREEIERIRAELITEIEPLAVQANSSALTLALRNLLENALKFSQQAAPPRIEIRALRSGDRVQVQVRDNGIGFDMSYSERIFQLFHRLHRNDVYPGTGIGLAIARKAIERMQGRIWAESAPGQGATFHIELPCAADVLVRELIDAAPLEHVTETASGTTLTESSLNR